MFDVKQQYISAITQLDDLKRNGESNEAVLQSCKTLVDVIRRDSRFRVDSFIQLSQASER